MARAVVLALIIVAAILIYANSTLNTTDGEFVNARFKSQQELDAEQRLTVVVANGIIIAAGLTGLPLSVVALSQTRWGRKVRRRLPSFGSRSRRKVLTPRPLASSIAHGAASSRGPFGFIAASYRDDPVRTLGWIGLVIALGVLPGVIWLSMLRL